MLSTCNIHLKSLEDWLVNISVIYSYEVKFVVI